MKNRTKRRGVTSVQIRPPIAKLLERFVRQGASKSELINEALRQYLTEKEFQAVRAQVLPYAQAGGIYTDEDVERALQ